MKVEVELGEGMQFTSVGQDGVAVAMDASAVHGGQGKGLQPMELMLIALGSCTGMDVISILRKKRQDVTAYRIEVSGKQAVEYPHVFTQISLRHIVTGHNVSQEAVRRAIGLSEATYCPAYAMLSKATPIETTFEILPA